MSENVLAIDIGTQSLRASVVTADGEILGIAQIQHETDSPHTGWSQQRPAQWWDETCQAIRSVLARNGVEPQSIAAVATCGQMHGPVGIDADGTITTEWVQLWCDKRCAPQVQAVREACDETPLMQLAANPLNPAWTGIKVRWEKENNPESYRRTRWYLVPKDFINFKLTGIAAADPSEASCSYLVDCNSGEYSQELADAVGVDLDKFAPVHASHEVIGEVTEQASELTGVPAGIPVVAGAGDFPVSMLGFGIVGEGVTADVTGTSSLLASHTRRPLIDPAVQNCRHAVDGWIPFTIIDCGGISVKWCKDLMSSPGTEIGYDSLIELAREAPPGSEGLFFFPYMLGERRAENVNARGGYFGITLDHDARHFIRAVMEGVAFAIGKDAEVFRRHGLEPDRILSVGGGTRNELWNRIKSSIMRLPLDISSEPEAGIKGCALLAAAGAGLIDDVAKEAAARRAASRTVQPEPETFPLYAAAQQEFNRIYQHMLGFWQ